MIISLTFKFLLFKLIIPYVYKDFNNDKNSGKDFSLPLFCLYCIKYFVVQNSLPISLTDKYKALLPKNYLKTLFLFG